MKKHTLYSRLQPLTLAVSAIVVTGNAAPTAAQGALEEVIVTAQKREESNQDVPIAITALTTEAIQNRGINNTESLLGQVPGIGGFNSPGSRSNVGLSIRGVSAGSPANLSTDPTAGIYLDGVFLGKMTGSSMDVAELERIEILRGPQGTLYGRNSTAGAINYVTRKPTGELGLRATASAGDYDLYSLKVNMDTPSIGNPDEGLGQLAASFGIQTRERDGFYDNVSTGEDFNDLDRQAWRIGLQWLLGDKFTADYAYDGSQLDEINNLDAVVGLNPLDSAGNVSRIAALQGTLMQAQAWAATPGTDPRIADRWIPSLQKTIDTYQQSLAEGKGRRDSGGIDVAPRSKSEGDGHALTLTWEGEDITLKSITALREIEVTSLGDIDDIDSRNDASGVGAWNDLAHLTLVQLYGFTQGFNPGIPQIPIDALYAGIDAAGGAQHFSQNSVADYEQFSQELQLVGSSDSLEYVLGLYYFDDEANYRRTSLALVPLAPIGETRYEQTTEAWALFGQSTWTPGWMDDRLSFTAGLRYTEEEKEIDWENDMMIGALSAPVAAMTASDEASYDNLSGNFTARFQATPDFNTYLRYATGYRSGGFNGESFASQPFDEETIEQIELGFKSDWWDKRLRVNGAVYAYTYEDLQVGLIDVEAGTPSSRTTNAGEAERWGLELEMLVAPSDSLVLGLSYAHIDGDYEEYPDVCGTNQPQVCFEGADFAKRAVSPDNMLNFFADYLVARTDMGDVTAYLNVNYQDEFYATSAWPAVVNGDPVLYSNDPMDSRTIVDARLSLDNIQVGDGNLRFTLWGKNLTDEDYSIYTINFGSSLGLITENYGDPRTWGVEVAYEY